MLPLNGNVRFSGFDGGDLSVLPDCATSILRWLGLRQGDGKLAACEI